MSQMETTVQESFRDYLANELTKRQKARPGYSLRSFANFLQVNPGNFSQFLSGKRNFHYKTIEQILEKIELSPEVRNRYLALFNEENLLRNKKLNKVSSINYNLVDDKKFFYIKDPIYFIFLNLITVPKYKKDNQAVAARLNITLSELDEIANKLMDLGLVVKDEEGAYQRVIKHLKTTDDVPSESVREQQRKVMMNGITSLDRYGVKQRDITTLTLPVNFKKMPKAKELIRKFQDDLLVLMSEGEVSDVYHLNVSLFPADNL